MNELLGTLIPLLMSGAGLGDILRGLGGSGRGAAGIDGLGRMTSTSLFYARRYFPTVTPQAPIDSAVESALARMGFNPYGQGGQAATAFLGSVYHLAPDMVGGMLGIPNGQRFMATVANSAAGISAAAGFGRPDMFNPYSVMAAHKRAIGMANVAYGLGTRPDGGYNIAYGHGLNMDEMGLVTQRLLASGVAYQDEKGNRIDPDKEAGKFKDNLEKLGSKFNEAASMLSKVTGSVEDALKFMDQLAGGNFLGGSQAKATEVADRARRMAASMRIVSSMSGMKPTELFRNMQGMAYGMTNAMGLDPAIASSSGFMGIMSNMAYNATMGYGAWAAMNPDASPQDKAAAMLGVNARVQGFARENGSAFAAMIADNKNMFSKSELDMVMNAARTGRINDVVKMVRDRIGLSTYSEYMTNPAMKIAAMNRAAKTDKAFYDDINNAMIQGNLDQAVNEGARHMIGKYMEDTDDDLRRITGRGGFGRERDEAVRKSLVDKAVSEMGLSRSEAEKWNVGELREALKKSGKYDIAEENRARLAAARRQIEGNTMTSEQEAAARSRLVSEIDSAPLAEEKKTELKDRLAKGEGIDSVYNEVENATRTGKDELRKRVYRGRLSMGQSKNMLQRTEMAEKSLSEDFTDAERFAAYEKKVKERNLQDMGSLKSLAFKKGDEDWNVSKAMGAFSENVNGLVATGKMILDDNGVEGAYGEAMNRMVSGAIGDKLGSMEGSGLDSLKAKLSEKMMALIKSGDAKTIKEAYRKAISDKGISGFAGLDDSGRKALEWIGNNADLGGESFFSLAAGVLEEREAGMDRASLQDMKDILGGNFKGLSGKDAFNAFMDAAKKTGSLDISDEELDKMRKELGDKITDDKSAKEQISAAASKMWKGGIKDNGFFAAAATRDPNMALQVMAAMQYKLAGGDVKALGFSDDVVNMVSKLDDVAANGALNPVANAWAAGGQDFKANAIKDTENRLNALKGVLGKMSDEDIRKYAKGGDAELAKKIEGQLGELNTESNRALIKTLGRGAKIGDMDALSVLSGQGLDVAKRQSGDKKYNESMLDIARGAGRNEGEAYQLMSGLGDFIRNVGRFFVNPEEGLRVRVSNRSLGVKGVD